MTKRIVYHACQHDCPDNCAMESIVQNGKVLAVNGRKDHPFTRGSLCSKVKRYDQRVYSDERIKFPMRRVGAKGEGHFQRMSWDEALGEISYKFKESIKMHGAESILPCSSTIRRLNLLGKQFPIQNFFAGWLESWGFRRAIVTLTMRKLWSSRLIGTIPI